VFSRVQSQAWYSFLFQIFSFHLQNESTSNPNFYLSSWFHDSRSNWWCNNFSTSILEVGTIWWKQIITSFSVYVNNQKLMIVHDDCTIGCLGYSSNSFLISWINHYWQIQLQQFVLTYSYLDTTFLMNKSSLCILQDRAISIFSQGLMIQKELVASSRFVLHVSLSFSSLEIILHTSW